MRRDARPVHLGAGRRSERLLLECTRTFPPRMPQRFLDGGEHRGGTAWGGTSARSRLNASAYAGGMTSLRFAAICPIFTNVGPSPQASWSPFRREARQHAMLPQDALDLAHGASPTPTLCRVAPPRPPAPLPRAWPRRTSSSRLFNLHSTAQRTMAPCGECTGCPAVIGRMPSRRKTGGNAPAQPRPAQTGAVDGGATRREGRERVRPVGLDDRVGRPACGRSRMPGRRHCRLRVDRLGRRTARPDGRRK